MRDALLATYGMTESGDDLPILLWSQRPSDDEIEAAYRKRLPQEYSEVGFVHWKISEAEHV